MAKWGFERRDVSGSEVGAHLGFNAVMTYGMYKLTSSLNDEVGMVVGGALFSIGVVYNALSLANLKYKWAKNGDGNSTGRSSADWYNKTI
jgi:hypothetical protein